MAVRLFEKPRFICEDIVRDIWELTSDNRGRQHRIYVIMCV